MRRTLSPVGIIIGLVIGIVGALVYAWQIDPQILTNVNPAQLARDGKRNYAIAISLGWARDGDVVKAANRLNDVGLTWTDVATFACELAKGPEAGTNGGLTAIRSMVALAETQGQRGCASDLVNIFTPTLAPTEIVIIPTATHVPPSSKTPTPTLDVTPTPEQPLFTATPLPIGAFSVDVKTFCAAEPVIEVLVQNVAGDGLAGMAITVQQDQLRETFFTGLKPERDPGYADYNLTPDLSYVVSLRDFPNTRTKALSATPCNAGSPDRVSFRVTYRRLPNS
ncbi:MAG: hypothetical protein KF716_08975 [Anaerolineae bacterium]|nr:hypothetical protein [Anaerolineae bacterium]